MNLKDNFKEYLESEKGYRQKTVQDYLYYFDKFGNREINKNEIYYFLVKRFKNNVARSFIKSYINFLNKHLNKDINIDKIMPEQRKQKNRKIPEVLSQYEIKAILRDMNNERDKIMLLLSFYGGLRVSELLNLGPLDFNWSEWGETKDENGDFANGKLTIREEGAKGGKERVIPIPQEIMKKIYKYIKNSIEPYGFDYLFPGTEGHLNKRTWQKILNTKGKKVLGKNVHPHMLRHSFGYAYINSTGDIRALQNHLGHSNLNTTQIYAQMSDKKMQDNYNKFISSLSNQS